LYIKGFGAFFIPQLSKLGIYADNATLSRTRRPVPSGDGVFHLQNQADPFACPETLLDEKPRPGAEKKRRGKAAGSLTLEMEKKC